MQDAEEKNDKDTAFRTQLLAALAHDEDVRQLIRSLAASSAGEKGERKKEARWREKYDRMAETAAAWEKRCRELETLVDETEIEARQKIEAAERKCERLEAQKQQLLQTLNERFARGHELYEALDGIDPYLRGLLKGAVPREGFEAFIVGLAQDHSLPRLWEALREALRKQSSAEDCRTLWELFVYSVALVNAGKAQDIYVIEDVQVGDAFDVERHTLTSDSRAQGNITQVLLPGYRNTYRKTIEYKSLVKI